MMLRLRPVSADPAPPTHRRRAFGLDSPLPADRHAILRSVLRHIAEQRPGLLVFRLVDEAAAKVVPTEGGGVEGPDLLLFAPGGRCVFVTIKPQAVGLTRSHRAFADLCRSCAVPLAVVRSLPEARQAFDALHL